MAQRDDFAADIKRVLATRVGLRCSNPDCRAPTAGPQSDPAKAINIGVAAHIAAASPGGPRFDAGMSNDERAGATNGIWLCQNCAKKVDNDAPRFTSELLRAWKLVAESVADASLGRPVLPAPASSSPSTAREKAIAAITTNAANAESAIRAFMAEVAERVSEISKELQTSKPPTFDHFREAIDAAMPAIREFADVASAVAEFAPEKGSALMRGFEPILELYEPQAAGSTWNSSFDAAKFVGHEALLILVATMVRFERWKDLKAALSQPLFAHRLGERRPLDYRAIYATVHLANQVSSAPGHKWLSPHGEILRARYEPGVPITFEELTGADYLIYLASSFEDKAFYVWPCVTAPYLKRTPEWLERCQSRSHLNALMVLFGVETVTAFREVYAKVRVPRFDQSFHLDIRLMKPDRVGTHP